MSQTLDISSRFFQHFAILLYIDANPAFLLPEQINHYYIIINNSKQYIGISDALMTV